MTLQPSVVVCDPVRTAIGTLGGSLKDAPALERQIELVFVALGVAAIFRAAISQHAAEPYLPRIIERHDVVVDEIGRRSR